VVAAVALNVLAAAAIVNVVILLAV